MKEFIDFATEIYENATLILNPNKDKLRELAKKDEITNNKNIPLYHTETRARSANETIGDVNEAANKDEILAELEKVKEYLKNKEMVCVEHQLCTDSEAIIKNRFLVTKDFARLALMSQRNFFKSEGGGEPDTITIDVPEWENKVMYVDPETHVNVILGSDYYGEAKMSFLRMGMHIQKQTKRGLGLHAGSKLYRVGGEEKGVLIFGLSGTGKTTITVHDHDLKEPEGVTVLQDDIVFLTHDGKATGTEENFYVKTDSVTRQPEMLPACTDADSIIENVPAKSDEIDFDDTEFCKNGRAIAIRKKVKNADGIDLPRVDIMFFATRRNDLPIAGRLTSPEQAATFYMLGESIMTSAGTMDASKVGASVRKVGYDPFIIGDKQENGRILLDLLKKNPGIQVYVLNTGKIGGTSGIKILPSDTLKTVEEIVRDRVEWKFDKNVGYEIPTKIEGVDLEKFDPYVVYEKGDFEKQMQSLRKERKNYIAQFRDLDFLTLE